jgi:hypothetical protein
VTQEKREIVEHYLNGDIEYETLEASLGEEAAEVVRESEKQLDEAEDLAEELSKL